MRPALTLLILALSILISTEADAQGRKPKKKRKSPPGIGVPVPVPVGENGLELGDSVYAEPNYNLTVWSFEDLQISVRLEGGASAEKISGTVRFRQRRSPITIITFSFFGQRSEKLGSLSLPIVSSAEAGEAAYFCTVIESSIDGAYGATVTGYQMGEPQAVTSVEALIALEESLDLSTACRGGMEDVVYVIGGESRTIHAVPTDIWYDRKSPFWERVIMRFDCD